MRDISKDEMIAHIEEALEHIRDAELDDAGFSLLIDVYNGVAEILEHIDAAEGEDLDEEE